MPLVDIFGGVAIWVVMVVLFVVSLLIADKLEDYVPLPAPEMMIGIMMALAYLIDAIIGR